MTQPHPLTLNEARQRAGRWRPPSRVLVIQASPRGERGVAERLSSSLIRGMEGEGARVQLVRLAGLRAEPCRGCFKCWTSGDGRCPIDDDLGPLVEDIPGHDLMLWVTPLYMEGMPGLMKNFVDRMMVLNHPSILLRDGRCLHPCRHESMPDLAAAAVAGFYGLRTFDPLRRHLESLAVDQHTPLRAVLLRPDGLSLMHPLGREAFKGVDRALVEAGRNLVRRGSVPEEVSRAVSRPLVSLEQYLELAKQWWTGEPAGGSGGKGRVGPRA